MISADNSRIRVLLVDDNFAWAQRPADLALEDSVTIAALRESQPDFWDSWCEQGLKQDNQLPKVPLVFDDADSRGNPELARGFDLRVLSSAVEAKRFWTLSSAIAQLSRHRLMSDGWVPEIIVFDYALTGRQTRIEELPPPLCRLVSPIPDLEELAEELDIDVSRVDIVEPSTGAPKEGDTKGCYAGGVILLTFIDHPCGAVPTTAKTKDFIEGNDAGFFEWFVEDGLGKPFDDKWRSQPRWEQIIPVGVRRLRARIEELTLGGIIQPSLRDLLLLAEGGACESFELWSKYGARRLPVSALFLDKSESPQDWAKRMLIGTLDRIQVDGTPMGGGLEDLAAGRRLADALWAVYSRIQSEEVDGLRRERADLSRLTALSAKSAVSPDEQKQLARLRNVFGVEGGQKSRECTRRCQEVTGGEYSDRARRWAVLFILVCLEHLCAEANQRFKVLLNQSGNPEIVPAGSDHVAEEDAYVALFFVPSAPIVLKGYSTDRWTWYRNLTRLNDKSLPDTNDPNNGNLGIKIADVQQGCSWSRSDDWSMGLFPGERFLLQLYTDELGFNRKYWPRWIAGRSEHSE